VQASAQLRALLVLVLVLVAARRLVRAGSTPN
jgi:hypothetical protein